MHDDQFLTSTADRLAALPTVEAVTLGGSRAQGTHRPDSDWDLAIYYRGSFDPQSLRDTGWPGDVSEVGGWGGGVFNGGAWLTIDGRAVDVHYRDLDVIDRQLRESEAGRFHIEPLMFHIAGIPSYLVVGELTTHRVLHGSLPRPDYPDALRVSAGNTWWDLASGHFDYAENAHARHGRVTQCAGMVALAAVQASQAILAARGEWVTNEKTLLDRAGLREIDDLIAEMTSSPEVLIKAVRQARALARNHRI